MRDVTLLWALRSPCNLGCSYCYFGTIEDHRTAPPSSPGQLSHLSRSDLDLADITAFCATIADSRVARVFLAGGEPLIWPHTLDIVAALKAAGVQVVLCTNGIPLNRGEITDRILTLGVDAVSVSLDSADAADNDRLRPARNGTDGWATVVSGIQTLLEARADRPTPKIGLYAAITRRNVDALPATAAFAAGLGLDYFVPQPISLAPDHALHTELSLRPADRGRLAAALDDLYRASGPAIALPAPTYRDQFLTAAAATTPGVVASCFGGRDLYFIQPDGSVWSCPSYLKIGAVRPEQRRSIRGNTAADLFALPDGCSGCALFSRDCVSMWPLMDFDRFLHQDQESRR